MSKKKRSKKSEEFLKNLAKSAKYGIKENVLKPMNPEITDMMNQINNSQITDNDAFKGNNLKGVINKYFKNPIQEVTSNTMEDIKSGHIFGNEARSKEAEKEAMKAFGFDVDEFTAALDEAMEDFDFNDSDDETKSSDSNDIFQNTNNNFVTNAFTINNEEPSKQVNMATNAILNTNRNFMQRQLNALTVMSSQLASLGEFNHTTNEFYETTTEFFNDFTTLFKEVNLMNEESYEDMTMNPFGEMGFDFQAYLDHFKKNSMDDEMKDVYTSMAKTMIADPLGTALSMAADKLIPRGMKRLTEEFNTFIYELPYTLNNYLLKRAGDGSIFGFIADKLGIRGPRADDNLLGKYKKDRVHFDGMAKRSITHVIPEFLSKILKAVTGGKQDLVFDYDRGILLNRGYAKELLKESYAENHMSGQLFDHTSNYEKALKARKGSDGRNIYTDEDIYNNIKEITKLQDAIFTKFGKSFNMEFNSKDMSKLYKEQNIDLDQVSVYLDHLNKNPVARMQFQNALTRAADAKRNQPTEDKLYGLYSSMNIDQSHLTKNDLKNDSKVRDRFFIDGKVNRGLLEKYAKLNDRSLENKLREGNLSRSEANIFKQEIDKYRESQNINISSSSSGIFGGVRNIIGSGKDKFKELISKITQPIDDFFSKALNMFKETLIAGPKKMLQKAGNFLQEKFYSSGFAEWILGTKAREEKLENVRKRGLELQEKVTADVRALTLEGVEKRHSIATHDRHIENVMEEQYEETREYRKGIFERANIWFKNLIAGDSDISTDQSIFGVVKDRLTLSVINPIKQTLIGDRNMDIDKTSFYKIFTTHLTEKIIDPLKLNLLGEEGLEGVDEKSTFREVLSKRINISIIDPLKTTLIGEDKDLFHEKSGLFGTFMTRLNVSVIKPFQDFLFGEKEGGRKNILDRLIDPSHKDNMKKLGIGGGLGGVAGLILGHPLLGVMTGLATQTDTYKNMMFGEDGKGGLVQKMKLKLIGDDEKMSESSTLPYLIFQRVNKSIINPLYDRIFNEEYGILKEIPLHFTKLRLNLQEKVKPFMKNLIKPYLYEAKLQMKLFGKKAFSTIKGFMKNRMEKSPFFNELKTRAKKLFSRIGKRLEKTFGVMGKIIMAPLKMLRSSSDNLIAKQIARVQSGEVDASEYGHLFDKDGNLLEDATSSFFKRKGKKDSAFTEIEKDTNSIRGTLEKILYVIDGQGMFSPDSDELKSVNQRINKMRSKRNGVMDSSIPGEGLAGAAFNSSILKGIGKTALSSEEIEEQRAIAKKEEEDRNIQKSIALNTKDTSSGVSKITGLGTKFRRLLGPLLWLGSKIAKSKTFKRIKDSIFGEKGVLGIVKNYLKGPMGLVKSYVTKGLRTVGGFIKNNIGLETVGSGLLMGHDFYKGKKRGESGLQLVGSTLIGNAGESFKSSLFNAGKQSLKYGLLGMKIGSVFPGIGTAIGGVGGAAIGFISGLFGSDPKQGMQNIKEGITSTKEFMGGLKDKFISGIGNFFQGVTGLISKGWNLLKLGANTLVDKISTFGDYMDENAEDIGIMVADKLTQGVSFIWKKVTGFIVNLPKWLIENRKKFFSLGKGLFQIGKSLTTASITAIKGIGKGIFKGVLGIGKGLVKGAFGAVKGGLAFIGKLSYNIVMGIVDSIKNRFKNVFKLAHNIGKGFVTVVDTAFNFLLSPFKSIANIFTSVSQKINNVLVKGINRGIGLLNKIPFINIKPLKENKDDSLTIDVSKDEKDQTTLGKINSTIKGAFGKIKSIFKGDKTDDLALEEEYELDNLYTDLTGDVDPSSIQATSMKIYNTKARDLLSGQYQFFDNQGKALDELSGMHESSIEFNQETQEWRARNYKDTRAQWKKNREEDNKNIQKRHVEKISFAKRTFNRGGLLEEVISSAIKKNSSLFGGGGGFFGGLFGGKDSSSGSSSSGSMDQLGLTGDDVKDITQLAVKYETGGNGAETIAKNAGDYGGASYGKYQYSKNMGSLGTFVKFLAKEDPEIYQQLMGGGVKLASSEFDKRWVNIARTNPRFGELQDKHTMNTFYVPMAKRIAKDTGVDITKKSKALQAAVFSTAVQHGMNSRIPSTVIKRLGPGASEADIISGIYDERGAGNGSKHFKSSSRKIQQNVADRFKREKVDSLNLLKQESMGGLASQQSGITPGSRGSGLAASANSQMGAPSKGIVNPFSQWRLTSDFGPRNLKNPPNASKMHKGVDLNMGAGVFGTPIPSVSDGKVTINRHDPRGYGNWIEIDGGQGYKYRYAHMQKRSPFKVGDIVRAGQTIGNVGSTGASSGPHLHFEVRKNGKPIHPLKHLEGYDEIPTDLMGSPDGGSMGSGAMMVEDESPDPIYTTEEILAKLTGKDNPLADYNQTKDTIEKVNELSPGDYAQKLAGTGLVDNKVIKDNEISAGLKKPENMDGKLKLDMMETAELSKENKSIDGMLSSSARQDILKDFNKSTGSTVTALNNKVDNVTNTMKEDMKQVNKAKINMASENQKMKEIALKESLSKDLPQDASSMDKIIHLLTNIDKSNTLIAEKDLSVVVNGSDTDKKSNEDNEKDGKVIRLNDDKNNPPKNIFKGENNASLNEYITKLEAGGSEDDLPFLSDGVIRIAKGE